jgi:hypothetical protein
MAMQARRTLVAVVMAVLVLLGVAVESGFAGDGEVFQLALIAPIQFRDESLSIRLLRLNLIYGRNVSVQGLDIGLINHCTGGTSLGLQYGLVGYIEGNFVGWQTNAIDVVKGRFTGLQTGIFNQMGNGEAVQWGFVNVASDVRGFQLGIINYTQRMYGLQIGILNVIRQKESLPVLPVINWSF